jgi:prepilin-type N-terminal cleavage/methylation domain-containing protein
MTQLYSMPGDIFMAHRLAFTLSELLVAVAVIAILSVLLVRAVHRVRESAAQAQLRNGQVHSVSARHARPTHPRRTMPTADVEAGATRVPQHASVERRLP